MKATFPIESSGAPSSGMKFCALIVLEFYPILSGNVQSFEVQKYENKSSFDRGRQAEFEQLV